METWDVKSLRYFCFNFCRIYKGHCSDLHFADHKTGA